MAKPRNNLRLFVAAYPPRELVEAMFGVLDAFDLPEHRRTPVEQVHLTLQFIGDVAVKDLDRTIESVERATGGLVSFELTSRRLISLPKGGMARLIAIETDAPPPLLELQRRLAHRLAMNVRRKPDDRFLPHVTLCRFRAPTSIERIERAIDLPPFTISALRLMRSTLRPEAVEHMEIARIPLSA